ncbi:hypothetical protein AAFC00_005113 [Neodothiora populina]|uniref:beta-glucosidase n=1 Tax=Neodothiora populina TaxID=2781224 RepID=A0ABR3PJU5_9PEZI
MPSIVSSLLLASAGLSVAGANYTRIDGPLFPETVYPGRESENPVTIAGSKTNQTSPPKYPSPWGEGLDDWADAYEKARAFVSQLTLEEKVNLTTGTGWELDSCVGQTGSIPRLGFKALCLQDSPTGVRDTDFNSVFPAGVNAAAAWDRGLAYARGKAMGEEHRDKGVDMQLGPVAGPLGRAPTGGRNWEGFSPDPYLTGELFATSIKGIQSNGILTSAKHFLAYEQEHFRLAYEAVPYGFNITESVSANLDDITMHEMYLWPFANGVKAGAASVMCSYNSINNSQACQNSYTLNYLLKQELGFQGFVISDWYGTHSGRESMLAGLDMTMPGDPEGQNTNTGASYYGSNLTIAVLNGSIPQWRIDDATTRIVAAWYYVGLDNKTTDINFNSWTLDTYNWEHWFVGGGAWKQVNQHVDVRGSHAPLIREIAAKSTVLLKNVNNTLPLTGSEKLTAVFGYDAIANPEGNNACVDRQCDNGTLAMGWGSGSSNFASLITPDMAISNEVAANGGAYEAVTDNYALAKVGPLARRADVSLVFVNADSGEGYIVVDGNYGDRNNLTLWGNGDALIEAVAANSSNTVVIIHSVGAVLMDKYKNHDNITAILWAGIPGEQSGNAIADVLYGRVNPSGKLPFSMAKNREDWGADVLYKPNAGTGGPQTNFKEGIFIDYRGLDKHNITPTYEFGYGISYTNYTYSNIKINKHEVSEYTAATGKTSSAPTYGTIDMNPAAHVFPANFTRVPMYLYPWINSTNLSSSSADTDYGKDVPLPAGAYDNSSQAIVPAGGAPGGNPLLWDVIATVTVDIKNVGKVAGEEVAQLYVSHGGPYDAPLALRGFEKVLIQPNQTATASFDILRRDIMNWSPTQQNWYVSNYTKTIYVGASSRNLPLSLKF